MIFKRKYHIDKIKMALIITFLLLNVIDVILTYIGVIMNNAYELNFLIRKGIILFGIWGVILIKIVGILILYVLIIKFAKIYPKYDRHIHIYVTVIMLYFVYINLIGLMTEEII